MKDYNTLVVISSVLLVCLTFLFSFLMFRRGKRCGIEIGTHLGRKVSEENDEKVKEEGRRKGWSDGHTEGKNTPNGLALTYGPSGCHGAAHVLVTMYPDRKGYHLLFKNISTGEVKFHFMAKGLAWFGLNAEPVAHRTYAWMPDLLAKPDKEGIYPTALKPIGDQGQVEKHEVPMVMAAVE